jgi:hypothetical protein
VKEPTENEVEGRDDRWMFKKANGKVTEYW